MEILPHLIFSFSKYTILIFGYYGLGVVLYQDASDAAIMIITVRFNSRLYYWSKIQLK